MNPAGTTFSQKKARELSLKDDIIIICGHYEGYDARISALADEEISIGDYILTGGELGAMVVTDAITRLFPGVINEDSTLDETFENDLLEYPQYTRPEVWMGRRVPEVLLSGHHANIEKWRKEKQIEKTKRVRPELLEKADIFYSDRTHN